MTKHIINTTIKYYKIGNRTPVGLYKHLEEG